jgi:prophage antirepressor-like protein
MHWVGKDVCDRLGFHRALTEADVFRLIVGSELPAAERFRVWLFEEVLAV